MRQDRQAVHQQASLRGSPTAIDLLQFLVHGVFRSALRRQLVPTIVGGFLYTVLQTGVTSWLWTPYGMLLGTAIGLMFDEDADMDLNGPLDRVDHAAMAVAMGLLLHVIIYLQ